MGARSLTDAGSLAFHHAVALVGAVSGRTARRLAAPPGRAAILMYHRVLPDSMDASGIEPGMYVRASTFERQIEWIKSRWRIRPLGALLREPPGPEAPPEVALTFDDGWRDNLTVAWPILQRHGVRATVFVVRDWVATGRNGAGEFVRPDELREWVEQGMEIGAHTATHPRLDGIDPTTAEREMRLSQEAVEQWTGRPCDLFAYPYGAHNGATADLARRLFRAAVTVAGGWWEPRADPSRLPRIGIHQDMTSTRALFERRLASWC